MATHTTNYNLTKPGQNDLIDISDLNDNFDAIDAQMKANADAAEAAAEAIPPVATENDAGIVKPDGSTITIDEDGTIHGANTYVLPPASVNTLGGVKIGDNLTIDANGKLNAYASLQTDAQPTQGSQNVPLSGGTFSMIRLYADQVDSLELLVQALNNGLNWLDAVNTFTAIATAYPSPSIKDTVACLDTGFVWYYDGTNWVHIFNVLLTSALTTAEVRSILNASS